MLHLPYLNNTFSCSLAASLLTGHRSQVTGHRSQSHGGSPPGSRVEARWRPGRSSPHLRRLLSPVWIYSAGIIVRRL